jgi:hypothetical protein
MPGGGRRLPTRAQGRRKRRKRESKRSAGHCPLGSHDGSIVTRKRRRATLDEPEEHETQGGSVGSSTGGRRSECAPRGAGRVGCENSVRARRKPGFAGRTPILALHTRFKACVFSESRGEAAALAVDTGRSYRLAQVSSLRRGRQGAAWRPRQSIRSTGRP